MLFGAFGVWLGFPLADPIVGLLITAAILVIVWHSAKEIIHRALDAVAADVPSHVRHAASHVAGVREVKEVRARWLGHQLLAEVNIAVDASLTVEQPITRRSRPPATGTLREPQGANGPKKTRTP